MFWLTYEEYYPPDSEIGRAATRIGIEMSHCRMDEKQVTLKDIVNILEEGVALRVLEIKNNGMEFD